ncbi:hypothetical protein [Pseudonocardia sp. NPDC049635]|uniref:hypothetical protein n=1 Tax=Pseudonocardia sp. NPDC049635 TaxID=3155506 RepID=UPI0033CEF48F
MAGRSSTATTSSPRWPYDGPRDPELNAAAAVALSELVRYLNNTTRYPGALGSPAAVVQLVATLESAAARLDQLLAHVAGHLPEAFTLYDDRGDRSGADTCREVAGALDQARVALGPVVAALAAAAQAGNHLGHH